MAFSSPPEQILRSALRNLGSVRRLNTSSTSQNTYRAAVCTELGKPLEIQNVSRPAEVPDGHVRVAVHSSGINFADILICQGKYQEKPPLPYIPGSEWAGIVLETASDVTNVKKGDRVFGLAGGGGSCFAEEALILNYFVMPLPDNIPFPTAAGFVTSYATAYGALSRKAKIQEGETVLVTAAAGATGLACVDLAANVFKCKVIAACGSDEKCEVAKSRGAWKTINYRSEDLRTKVKELTGGEGANIIVDMVGGDTWAKCVRCVAFEGRLVVIGFASGDIPKMATNALLLKSATAVGFYWGNFGMRGHPFFLESIQAVSRLLAEGKITPYVSDTFPLNKINDAFDYVMQRKSKGKVVITCRE